MASSRSTTRRAKPSSKERRRLRTTLLLRWSILAVAVFVGFLYYQPLSSYLATRSALNERATEVAQLRQERARLQARLAHSSTVTALAREARRMRLVKPGERIFIVKGVEQWRRAEARAKAKAASTIDGNG